MSDILQQIAENLGVGSYPPLNNSYLYAIADYYGVDTTTSKDLMADILTEVGGDPSTSTDYLQDIVLALGGTVTINGNWMEAWEAITATPPVPVNTTPPALSGKYRYEGEAVDTDDGIWDNSPTSFTYQWYRDATPISGETLSQYILTSADADTYVSCEVTAINGGGSSTPEPSDSLYIFDHDYASVYYYYEDTAEAESILQNQFMLAIKAAGVWAKLDVLCVFRGSGDGSALVDWKRITEVTNIDCAFDTTQGFILNGIDCYINTECNLSTEATNYTLNNASRYFFPYALTSGPLDGQLGGSAGAANRMVLANTAEQRINQSAGNLNSAFEYTTTVNVKSIHRTSATDVTLFNGTTSASRTATSTVIRNSDQIIGRSAVGGYADATVAAYAAGASMVAENTAFVAAWNTYITAL